MAEEVIPPWGGDDPATMPGADAILVTPRPLNHTEAELLRFYKGTQWPADVERLRKGRPCLVLNRLPSLVAIAVSRSRVPMTESMMQALILQITDRNYDAQMAHNYLYSAVVERAGLAVQKAREEAKENGVA